MPSYQQPSARIAESLSVLAEARQDPSLLTEWGYAGELEPTAVIMTSMGSRRKAIITPYFAGIEFEHKLPSRVIRAQAIRRPFVEAVIGLGDHPTQPMYLASVTLRLGMFDHEREMIEETSWQYPLKLESLKGETTWDVVDAIGAAGDEGSAIRNRSGLVVVTPERLNAKNWAISHKADPDQIARDISYAVTDEIHFTRFE